MVKELTEEMVNLLHHKREMLGFHPLSEASTKTLNKLQWGAVVRALGNRENKVIFNRKQLIHSNISNPVLQLLASIELSRLYYEKIKGIISEKEYIEMENQVEDFAKSLYKLAAINSTTPLNHILLQVQRVYDKKYGIHQIFLFEFQNGPKAVFKGKKIASHENFLCILNDGKYFGVKNASRLYGRNTFCLECGTTYSHGFIHKKTCPNRCPACTRVGIKFPCKGDDKILCEKCNREFRNQECFDSHIDQGICGTVIHCPECCTDDILHPHHGGTRHQCGSKYCHLCRIKHKPNQHLFNF